MPFGEFNGVNLGVFEGLLMARKCLYICWVLGCGWWARNYYAGGYAFENVFIKNKIECSNFIFLLILFVMHIFMCKCIYELVVHHKIKK